VLSVFATWSRNIVRGAISPAAQQRLWQLLSETNTATALSTSAAPTAAAAVSNGSSGGWRLFPARGGGWVSLNDTPVVPDDAELSALFEGTPGLSFLQLPRQHGRCVIACDLQLPCKAWVHGTT
jgi:hypothetical protein